MKKFILPLCACALIFGAAACNKTNKVEEDTAKIENDSTTIIVSVDSSMTADSAKAIETSAAASTGDTAK